MKYLLLFILFIGLSSCGHFHSGGSIWGGGSWIFPWLTGIGSAIFWVAAYRSWKSGTKKLRTLYTPEEYLKNRLPFWSSWAVKFAIALLVVTIGIIWAMNAEK